MIGNLEIKNHFTIKRKRIYIWIDKDLANHLHILNKKENKLFFEYELKDFLYENNISIPNFFLPSYKELDYIDNHKQAILVLSSIMLRIKQTSTSIDEIIEQLEFIETITKY